MDKDEEKEEDIEDTIDIPTWKYRRLGLDVAALLKSKIVTCFETTKRFLVVGTDCGETVLFTASGTALLRYRPHGKRVNAISVDRSETFVGTCSEDGTVCVKRLSVSLSEEGAVRVEEREEALIFDYENPLKALCLDPAYERSQSFCVGGTSKRCIVNRKGWFGNTNTVISEGEGVVTAVSWGGNYVAWKNELGVKIYDPTKEARVAHVPLDPNSCRGRSDLSCHLTWEGDARLLIGWADSIRIVEIRRRRLPSGKIQSIAEIVGLFRTPYFVCGVVVCGPDALAILSLTPRGLFSDEEEDGEEEEEEEEEEGGAICPELHVISRGTGEELSSDALAMRGDSESPKDYSLYRRYGVVSSDASIAAIYVVGRRDVVVATVGEPEDRVRWALDAGEHEMALRIVRRNLESVSIATRRRSFEAALDSMISANQWTAAAKLCSELTSLAMKNTKMDECSRLKRWYEMILNHFVEIDDGHGLARTIRLWLRASSADDVDNRTIGFDVERAVERIEAITANAREKDDNERDDLRELDDALFSLRVSQGEFESALQIYLDGHRAPLRPEEFFDFIERRSLLRTMLVRDRVARLVELHRECALSMLARHTLHSGEVELKTIIEQIDPRTRLELLHLLFLRRRSGNGSSRVRPFYDQQIALYVRYMPGKLLPFLKGTKDYSVGRALKLCSNSEGKDDDDDDDSSLSYARAYLLERAGSVRESLAVLVKELHDFAAAAQLASKHEDVWDDLIAMSLESKDTRFIATLLDHVASNMATLNPIALVEKIPSELRIPDVRNRIERLLRQANGQRRLWSKFHSILKRDVSSQMRRLHAKRIRAVRMGPDSQCAVCREGLGIGTLAKPRASVIFWSGVGYHADCLRTSLEGTETKNRGNWRAQ